MYELESFNRLEYYEVCDVKNARNGKL